MTMNRGSKFVASMLAATLAVTAMPVTAFADTSSDKNYSILNAFEVESPSYLDELLQNQNGEGTPIYGENDMVTVIVELDDASVMDFYDVETYGLEEDKTVGEAVSEFLSSEEVQEISDEMKENQNEVISDIEELVEDAVVEINAQWTIVTNGFSVSVPYGKLGEIRKMEGVKRAYVEHVYERPETVENSVEIDENKLLQTYSYDMVNVKEAWDAGYTGKGMLVAVLDSGIDIKTDYQGLVVREHEAFTSNSFLNDPNADDESGWELRYTGDSLKTFLEENQLNATTGSSGNKIVYDNNALYKNLKVPYAADYADGDVNVLPTSSNHGTHVSGTIAGCVKTEDGAVTFSGVAPDAQILFMKVFPDEDGGATESSIVNALEDALALGADVINLSLGSDNGYAVDDSIQNDVFAEVEKAGIVLMTSAGNSAYSSEGNNYDGHTLASNPDNSMISSPAVYGSNLGVASIDNMVGVQAYLTWTDSNGDVHEVPFSDPWEVAMKSDFSDAEYPVYLVDGVGTYDDYQRAGFDNGYNGGKTGIALVKRGEISFVDKINNAMSFSYVNWHNNERYGVKAVMVYDSDPTASTLIYMSVENTYIDSCFISGKDGAAMAEALSNGNEVKIKVSKTDKTIANTTAGEMSVFSSWGAGPGLELKPEITAPGGNIWSTVMDKSGVAAEYTGSYDMMSGTSMAAPHMSGIGALVRQYILANPDRFQVDATEMGDLISQLLVSTAIPQVDKDGVFYSPRQQGAGLVNVGAAIKTPAYITVEGKNIGKLELLDDVEKKGEYHLVFTVHNVSTEAVTYDMKVTLMRPDTMTVDSAWGERTVMAEKDIVIKEVSLGEVTVGAGETVTVDKTVRLTEEEKAVLDSLFENGIFVEGFVSLMNDEVPDLGLPMLAFYGDWTKAPIFDSNTWLDDPQDGERVDNNETTWGTNLFGSCIIYKGEVINYMNLGQNPYDPFSTENQLVYHEENITISPDGNGYFDKIDDPVLYQLRNARFFVLKVVDKNTGEIYFQEGAAYPFKTTAAAGFPMPYSAYAYGLIPIWNGTDLDGNVLPSGTECIYSVTAYGEGDFGEEIFNEDYNANVTDFEKIITGEYVPTFNGHAMDMTGDVISFPVLVDTEAPKLVNNAVSFFEEDGRIYLEGTIYDEDGSLASLQVIPYTIRTYKEGYGNPDYAEVGLDRSNPFCDECFYDAGKKEYKFKVDVTEYAHTNESYAGENYVYDFKWNGNILISCGDYGANGRSYAIKTDATEGLVLSQTSARLRVGSEFELSVNNNTRNDAQIVRSSSRPEVATIDQYGKVVAKAAGQTVITVSNGIDEAYCVVVVEDYNHEVTDFDLSIDKFEGLKPNGEAIVKVTNLEPADVVIDEIRWEVSESDEYAENYGEGLISVGKYSEDALAGFVYLNVSATDGQFELPESIGTLTVTINGVSRSMEIGWNEIYQNREEDDIISALDYNQQIVYVNEGETAKLSAKYRQASLHSVSDVLTQLEGLVLDGADFYAVNGSYTAKLVNEEGYALPEHISVYTVYNYTNYVYESPMYENSSYGYYYNAETGEINIPHAPMGATNQIKIVASGVVSEGKEAGTLSGNTYERPLPLYGPFEWATTEGYDEITGTLEAKQETDYYGSVVDIVEYTPSEVGISYITATSEEGYTVNFAVVCEPLKATAITMNTHKLELQEGDKYQLSATLDRTPSMEEDKEIVWKSFDESVATVDENGVVTAVANGFAYMIAYTKADNLVSDYCVVKVEEALGEVVEGAVEVEDEALKDTVLKVVELPEDSTVRENALELIKDAINAVEKVTVFEIDLKNLDNQKVELNGQFVKVTIDLPEGMRADKVVVYRVDDENNTLVACETVVVNGKIVFRTNHFSTYIVAEDPSKGTDDTDGDNTGSGDGDDTDKGVTDAQPDSDTNSSTENEEQIVTDEKPVTSNPESSNVPKLGESKRSLKAGILAIGIIVLGIICCVFGMKRINKKED